MGADRIQSPLTLDQPFDPADLARWSGGVWEHPPRVLRGVMNDSRTIRPGNLYVALPGATVDGHAFVVQACRVGAAALVNTDWQAPADAGPLPLLRVPDTLQALAALGQGYRRTVNPVVIGVTGSVGKSTIKTWTAALLAAHAPTASTCGNFNTDIGLPLSLLQMERGTRLGVFELGMSHPGEIAPLAAVLEPDAAILGTIAPVHLEFFASLEAIVDEKAALLQAVPPAGFAVLDAGSPWHARLRAATRARVITVALDGAAADYHATAIDPMTGRFTVSGPAVDRPRVLSLGLPGRHHVLNALLSLAAARACDVPWEAIEAGLPRLPRMGMRWETCEWRGVTVINDAYNASPVSMDAAIRTFAAAACGRRILVLGEMRELGRDAQAYHAACGVTIGASGCEILVAVGSAGGWMADAAAAHGFAGQVLRVSDAAAAGGALARLARRGDWVLLKASRGVALEQAMKAWREATPPPAGGEGGT